MALIPCLYIGRSRAASSFSMPGSEAIFHGFVCAPSHRVELSLPASFMYSSLHCLYEVETTIHFRGWEVKKKFSGGKGFELGIRNEGGGFAAIDDEVVAVLAFVISHTTFLAAQDDETGRCPKVC